jgi:hypothetical protein
VAIHQPNPINQSVAPQVVQTPTYVQNEVAPVVRPPTAQSISRRSVSSITSIGSSQFSPAQTISNGSFSGTITEETPSIGYAAAPICRNCKKSRFLSLCITTELMDPS